MDFLRDYNIPFVGLKLGAHHFDYQIEKTFFDHFPDAIIEDCSIKVDLKLTKETTFLVLDFQISGTVEVPCNRCQRPLDYPVDADYKVIAKFGIEPSQSKLESDEDVIYLDRNETHINVAQLIYEFITLAIPSHHTVCENVGMECNPEAVKLLDRMSEKPAEGPDPRWAALKNIKINKK